MTTNATSTAASRSAAAVAHTDRARALLEEADKELAGAGPGSVPDRAAHRVQMAHAHAMVSLALSTLAAPAAAPSPPAG